MTTWRGILRDLDRAAKRSARQNAFLEKQQAKEELIKSSTEAIVQYENFISSVIALHRECCAPIDWELLSKSDPPDTISRENKFENIAKENKINYRPSSFSKILGRTDQELMKLDEEIQLGREKDIQIYDYRVREYESRFKTWKAEKDLATKVIKCDSRAIEEVFDTRLSLKSNPFIGNKIDIIIDDNLKITSNLFVHQIDEIIPSFELKQLKNGSLSKRDMPLSKRNNLYKDYLCSAVIRLARDFFAILPLEEILINAKCDQLNGKTGYMEEAIILSAFIPKLTIEKINLDLIEPSIAIENFIHNIDYKILSGFSCVQQVSV